MQPECIKLSNRINLRLGIGLETRLLSLKFFFTV